MIKKLRIACLLVFKVVSFEALDERVRRSDQIDKALILSKHFQYSFDIRRSVESRNMPQGTVFCQSILKLLVDSDVRFHVYRA